MFERRSSGNIGLISNCVGGVMSRKEILLCGVRRC